MSLSLIRKGMADNLGAIANIRVYEEVPDNPVMPCALIFLERASYNESFARGLTLYQFSVRVIVTRVTERRSQRRLDEFIDNGATSLKTALESDLTLDGAAFDATVTSLSAVGSVTIGETTYLAATFEVTVHAL
jgi:hypothetical protein